MTEKGPRHDRWYLPLMAPDTKGSKCAWLDPTSVYINATAYTDLMVDRTGPLRDARIDVVGGLVAIATETNPPTQAWRRDLLCVSAVMPGTH